MHAASTSRTHSSEASFLPSARHLATVVRAACGCAGVRASTGSGVSAGALLVFGLSVGLLVQRRAKAAAIGLEHYTVCVEGTAQVHFEHVVPGGFKAIATPVISKRPLRWLNGLAGLSTAVRFFGGDRSLRFGRCAGWRRRRLRRLDGRAAGACLCHGRGQPVNGGNRRHARIRRARRSPAIHEQQKPEHG